ncbi:MAG: NAD(P)-dependent malic enzyme [Patescibacteria group bacterium]|jgi:malate dehydrogenase (oxaloacetate-decarboxylating)
MADALSFHLRHRGKIGTAILTPIATNEGLALAYTPGVAEVSKAIAEDQAKVWDYTMKSRTVAVVTDGTAVLGLGDIGPEAALPVMEGKCLLHKHLGGVDAVPICLATKDPDEIVRIVTALAPGFGAIQLEDIAAPQCFDIEARLSELLDIPVLHDDQHATAVIALAALMNAAKVAGKAMATLEVVVSGAGAAGIAIARLVRPLVSRVTLVDSKGIVSSDRADLNAFKQEFAVDRPGSLGDALEGADVFFGVSKGGIVSREMVARMNAGAIVFAMANPEPEILPDAARAGGAAVIGTGRSDFPNQINNSLSFPGLFRGALDVRASRFTDGMKQAAAQAIADAVPAPTPDRIVPDPLDQSVAERVAKAVAVAARADGAARIEVAQ